MSRNRRRAFLTAAAMIGIAVAAWGVVRDGRGDRSSSASAPERAVAAPAHRGNRRGSVRAATKVAPPMKDSGTNSSAGAFRARAVAVTVFRRSPPAVAGATPRSVQVMRVPVPAELPNRSDVRWTMQPSRRAEVLSAPSGDLPGSRNDSSRAVTVVTRVPATAAAGVLPVGELTFTADSLQITVPVQLLVTRIRRASLTPGRPTYGGMGGRVIALAVEVRNLGNSVDTMTVTAQLPADWSAPPARRVVLLPGERRTVALETRLPVKGGTTTEYPVLRVRLDDSTVSETTVAVQVQDRESRQAAYGPQLRVGATQVAGGSANYGPVVDMGVSGPVAPGVSILGRANLPEPASIDRQALGRVGTYLGGAFLSLRGPTWYGTGGSIGTSISPLTGQGGFGHGFTGGVTRGAVSVSGLLLDVPDGSGLQAGVRGDYHFGSSTIGAAATHIQSGGVNPRELSAVSLLGSATPFRDVHAEFEGALRSFDGGNGFGVAATLTRGTPKDVVSLSMTHAPGGSQAFGPGLDSWSALAGRRFGDRVSVSLNSFASKDRPVDGSSEFSANGWVLTPRVKITPQLSVELMTRHSTSDSRSASTRLTTGENYTSIGVRQDADRLSWLVAGSVIGSERGTGIGSAPLSVFKATGYGVSSSAQLTLPRLLAAAGIDYSRTGEGVGEAPRQARINLSATRIAPFRSPDAPTFRAITTIYSWFGERSGVVIARAGADVPIGKSMSLGIDAERNPMLHNDQHPAPWIVAIRLERGFTAGWLSRSPATRGAVYQDLNANGSRDPMENGMAGVLVRRGDQTALTDRNGNFTLRGTGSIPVEVDPITLPMGMVAPVGTPGPTTKNPQLGVVPTAALTVHLTRAPDDLGRIPESEYSSLAVIARDDRGAEWYFRADSTGSVHFDALPPGRYTFVADFSATPERLRQVGDGISLDLHPGVNLPPLEIKFTLRQARLFNGGQGQTDQRRRR